MQRTPPKIIIRLFKIVILFTPEIKLKEMFNRSIPTAKYKIKKIKLAGLIKKIIKKTIKTFIKPKLIITL